MQCHQSEYIKKKKHPNSTSCRSFSSVVNYSLCYHLGWPFWGQNNLGFSCLWICSVDCQSCYKRRLVPFICICRNMVEFQQDAVHWSRCIYCLRDFSIPCDFYCMFALQLFIITDNFSVCEDSSVPQFFYYNDFFMCHNFPAVSLCPAASRSSILSSDRNMCRSRSRREAVTAGKSDFLPALWSLSAYTLLLLKFAPVSSKCVWCSSL